MKAKIAMIGGGSWATAIIKMLSDNASDKDVYWWMRSEVAIQHIKEFRHNPHYLSSVELKINTDHIIPNINEVFAHADYIILNVPAAFLKNSLSTITAEDFKGKKVISAIKGIVPDENLIIADFLHQTYQVDYKDILVISGPCHAEEVALEKLSYLTISCIDRSTAESFASNLNTHYIKTNISDDILGSEYSAVLKNIYAVASGICHGLGYGDNFQAVLISNAIREMKTFVEAVHPISRDIKESAYLGDLLVTAYSQFSRNRTFGNMIGKGYNVQSAQLEMNMVAEGYYAVKCVHIKNQICNVELPICRAVYRILYEGKSPYLEMKALTSYLT